jgi:hypothetical protein
VIGRDVPSLKIKWPKGICLTKRRFMVSRSSAD